MNAVRYFQRRILAAALPLLLVGCAAQNAYNEGSSLVALGQLDEGTAKLAEAQQLDPNNLQYRVAYRESAHRLAEQDLSSAEAAIQDRHYDQAAQALSNASKLEPQSEHLRIVQAKLTLAKRHDALLKKAKDSLARKDLDGAKFNLKMILEEDPNNKEALALNDSVSEQHDQARPASLAAAYKKPITIEFRDTPLRGVFEVLSRTSGLNFIFDRDVKVDQRTTVFLHSSTVENAVNVVLLTNQLAQRVVDANTILIYPATAAKAHDYQPLVVKSFYLRNGQAKEVANTLKTLLKVHDVIVDDKLNAVIIRDTPEGIKLAEKVVALHDIPDPEVMMDVEILEVARSKLEDLGVDWPTQLSLAPLATGTSTTVTLQNLLHATQATTSATITPMTLNLQQTAGATNILATPRIRAKSREKAKILIGDRVPIVTTTSTATGFVSDSINYIDVGLKLDVEPVVYADDDVEIKVALEVSSIVNQTTTKSGSQAYEIGTRNASTTLRLHDGENQILAGLIEDEDTKGVNSIPYMGNIPVIGYLLGEHTDNGTKTELILSITPHLVRNIQRPIAENAEFEAGTEGSARIESGASGGSAASGGFSMNGATGSTSSNQATTPPVVDATPANGANGPLGQNSLFSDSNSGTTGFGSNGTSFGNTASSATGDLGSAGTSYGASSTGAYGATTSSATAGLTTTGATGAATGATAGTASLSWSAPPSVGVNGTFTAQLLIQSSSPVVSLPISISFDPKTLSATTVQEGTFLKQTGGQTSFSSKIDNSGGHIYATDTVSGNTGGTAQGTLLTINFQAKVANPGSQVSVVTVNPIGLGGTSVTAIPPTPLTIAVTQ